MPLRIAKDNNFLKGMYRFDLPNYKCQEEVCIGATELCKKYCYGNSVFRHSNDRKKKMMPPEKSAIDNYNLSLRDDFVEQMNKLIKQNDSLSIFRIHSNGGDFYSYKYFLKWIDIINANKEIRFTAYVKNFTVLEKYMEEKREVPNNFNILLSFYPDTYDKYAAHGGIKYIDDLFKKLLEYYKAKVYKVCSGKHIISKIKHKDPTLYICSAGTKALCKKYNLDANEFKEFFIPNQKCSDCMKCYSDTKCPPGSTIYAVLRHSGSLANWNDILKDTNKFNILRDMYQQNLI